jgi:hypothetical protein
VRDVDATPTPVRLHHLDFLPFVKANEEVFTSP